MPYLGKMNIKAGIESDGDNIHLNRGSLRVTGKVTSGVRVLLKDDGDKILLATGLTVPSAAAGYAKGCLFIKTDASAGTRGLYENKGTTASCSFSIISEIAATESELNQAADISAQNSQLAPAAAVTAAAAAVKQSVVQHGDIVETILFIDLVGLKSVNTLGDIIGDTGVSYICQITDAINGTIFAGEMGCSEVPTTGDDDIDLYAATENTGAYDGAVGDLAETQLVAAGGAHAIGTVKPLTALPAANAYLYLTSGNGDTAGTYDAGQIYIKLFGYK